MEKHKITITKSLFVAKTKFNLSKFDSSSIAAFLLSHCASEGFNFILRIGERTFKSFNKTRSASEILSSSFPSEDFWTINQVFFSSANIFRRKHQSVSWKFHKIFTRTFHSHSLFPEVRTQFPVRYATLLKIDKQGNFTRFLRCRKIPHIMKINYNKKFSRMRRQEKGNI